MDGVADKDSIRGKILDARKYGYKIGFTHGLKAGTMALKVSLRKELYRICQDNLSLLEDEELFNKVIGDLEEVLDVEENES